MTTTKKQNAKRTSSKSTRSATPKPTLLDENTSARVLAEYLTIDDVKTAEIDSILGDEKSLSYREIALTFRVVDVLGGGVSDAFEMHPTYRAALVAARRYVALVKLIEESAKRAATAPEVQS